MDVKISTSCNVTLLILNDFEFDFNYQILSLFIMTWPVSQIESTLNRKPKSAPIYVLLWSSAPWSLLNRFQKVNKLQFATKKEHFMVRKRVFQIQHGCLDSTLYLGHWTWRNIQFVCRYSKACSISLSFCAVSSNFHSWRIIQRETGEHLCQISLFSVDVLLNWLPKIVPYQLKIMLPF